MPDMRVPATPVGINYEGGGHLELDRIVAAAIAAAENPGNALLQEEVAGEKDHVREKYVDDLRRTRELASRGLVIVNVTMEDLFANHGLDTLMQQVISAAERFSDRDFSTCWEAFDSPTVCAKRQLLIWALLDWKPGIEYMRQFMAQENSSHARQSRAMPLNLCSRTAAVRRLSSPAGPEPNGPRTQRL